MRKISYPLLPNPNKSADKSPALYLLVPKLELGNERKKKFLQGNIIMEASKMKRLKQLNQGGFTLIEILIVVMIIGLIASLVAPNLFKQFEKSKEKVAKAQVEMLSSSVQSFMLDVGRFPASLSELMVSDDKNGEVLICQNRKYRLIHGEGIININVREIMGISICIL